MRSRPAPGAWSSRRTPCCRARPTRRAGWVLASDDPLALASGARARVAARARVPGGGDHRVDGKDLGQGHLPHAPAAPRPREPGELQHRDRPAAGDPRRATRRPRCWCSRWRCAGMGQIAELCEIAEPDVAAITNVGPVHLELLGTLEAIAEAKAEILAGLGERGRRRAGRRRGARAASARHVWRRSRSAPAATSAPMASRDLGAHDRGAGRDARRASSASSSRSPRRTT